MAQSPHTYLGSPWAFYAWGLPKSLCAQSDKNATANQLHHLKNSRKNGAWGQAPTYKANQSDQFVTFEKLAKSPKFAKVTLKTSTANKPKTKQEIQSRHQNAAAKAAKSAAAKAAKNAGAKAAKNAAAKAAKSAAAKKANQPNPHQI